MKSYSEKLRDPRWQKMRLEIMQRDGFACRICHDEASTLNVHHRYYISGNDPWEYPLGALVTLCENCHKFETHEMDNACVRLGMALRAKFFASDIDRLARAIELMKLVHVEEVVSEAIANVLRDETQMSRLVDELFEECQRDLAQGGA